MVGLSELCPQQMEQPRPRSTLGSPLPTVPTTPPSLPSQAHLPGSISGSRSVKGYGDREGAGKVRREEEGIREKMVRSKVRVRETGRDGPQEHTLLQRNRPLCPSWAMASGGARAGRVWSVHTGAGAWGDPPTPEEGEKTQRQRSKGMRVTWAGLLSP